MGDAGKDVAAAAREISALLLRLLAAAGIDNRFSVEVQDRAATAALRGGSRRFPAHRANVLLLPLAACLHVAGRVRGEAALRHRARRSDGRGLRDAKRRGLGVNPCL